MAQLDVCRFYSKQVRFGYYNSANLQRSTGYGHPRHTIHFYAEFPNNEIQSFVFKCTSPVSSRIS